MQKDHTRNARQEVELIHRNQNCSTVGRRCENRIREQALAHLGVNRRQHIIEDEELGVCVDRARNREALLLPAAQRAPALTNSGVQALREGLDIGVK